jgi:hypothetical protein
LGEVEVSGEALADVEGDGFVVDEAGDGGFEGAEDAEFVFGEVEEVRACGAEFAGECLDVARVLVSHRVP